MSKQANVQSEKVYNAGIPDLPRNVEFEIGCVIYGENDADRQAILRASTKDVLRVAEICGCPSCRNYLINIRYTITAFSRSKSNIVKRQMRYNRCYFIQKLRDVLANKNAMHNFKNFIKEM